MQLREHLFFKPTDLRKPIDERIRSYPKARIYPCGAESPANLRHDIGSLGSGDLVTAPKPAAQITALTITLVGAASAYPVLISGQRAYKAIRGMSDDTGAEWLDEHMDRAEKIIGAFYFLAALALAGLLVPIKWPKSAFPLAVLTLVAAILCSGIAVYIAQPGGRVRHPEFRPNETPTPASETDHHDK